jgi:hypothetical protein
LLYSLFGLFLKRETLHGFNRIVLLAILEASMVLPLCQIETGRKNIVTQSREKIEYQIANVQNPLSGDVKKVIITNPDNGVKYTHIPIRDDVNAYILIAIAIYLLGLLVCWLRYLWQLSALLLLIHRSKRIDVEGLPKGVHALVHPDIKTPCSWMCWMLLNPADINMRPIIKHELSHIRLGHSWDMLLCELTCRMLWFVPFVWMLRQDLRDVHEYQADRRVLQGGIKDEEYQLLLIKKATSTGLQPVVNAFNQSPIKRRFKMMYRKPSRRWVALKAAYLLPLGALALMAFARPQVMSDIEKKVEKAAPTIVQNTKALFTGAVNFSEEEPLYTGTLTTGNDVIQLENAHYSHEAVDTVTVVGPDANLVKADLKDQTEEELRVTGLAKYKEINELVDSVMQAVGARKLYEGAYYGHFQPNLNTDTVRICHVKVLDKQSQIAMASGISSVSENDPYAYELTLQQGTRKGETGYYIRYLQPVNSNTRNYDKPKNDPKILSTDKVLTKKDFLGTGPAAIELTKKETRWFMYLTVNVKDEANVIEMISKDDGFRKWAIHDVKTGDNYMYRSFDESYLKQVKQEENEDGKYSIYQICLVFPPLGKKVDVIKLKHIEEEPNYFNTYRLKDIPRKPHIITN